MAESPEEKTGALLSRIGIYGAAGDYRKMLQASEEFIAACPTLALGHFFAGKACLNLDRIDEGRSHLEKALALDPQDADVHSLLANALGMGRRFKEAEQHIRKALELEPESSMHWCVLAHLCHAQQDLDCTTRYARKALELDPENVAALNLLGMAAPENSPKAAEAYRKALEIDPEDAYVHNNLGVDCMEACDYAQAERHFRKALSIDPREKIFRKNLFVALKHQSVLYKILTVPGDISLNVAGWVSDRWWTIFFVLLIPMTLLRAATRSGLARPGLIMILPLAAFVVWVLVFLPLRKLYEFLILSDLKAAAGEVGARKGGPLRLHSWPFWLRYSIVFLAMIAVWSGIALAFANPSTRVAAFAIIGAGVIITVVYSWVMYFRNKRRDRRARERRMTFSRVGKKR